MKTQICHYMNKLHSKLALAALLSAMSTAALADHDYYRGYRGFDGSAVVGGAVGGGAGAAVGSMIGGRDGAIIGGALGGAAGAAIGSSGPSYRIGYPAHGHYRTYGHPGWGNYKFKHHKHHKHHYHYHD
jgi:hypothetical protein